MKTRDLIVLGGLAFLAWQLLKPAPKKMPGQIGEEYGDDPTETASAKDQVIDVKKKLQVMPGEGVPADSEEAEQEDYFSDEALEAF